MKRTDLTKYRTTIHFMAIIVLSMVFTSPLYSQRNTRKKSKEVKSETFAFRVENNAVTITGWEVWSEPPEDLIIPDMINGYPVRIINGRAFAGKRLRSVTISDNVTIIRAGAFANNNIMRIVLSKNLPEVDWLAFENNPITEVVVTQKIEIKGKAFYWVPNAFSGWYQLHGCRAGTYIYSNGAWSLNGDNPPPHSILTVRNGIDISNVDGNNGQFYISGNIYILPPGDYKIEFSCKSCVDASVRSAGITLSAGKTYKIEGTGTDNMIKYDVTGNDGFDYSVHMGNVTITGWKGYTEHVTIPDSIDGIPVTAIGRDAFKDKKLRSVALSVNLEFIGKDAFYGNNLNSLVLPKNLGEVYEPAFDENHITTIEVPLKIDTKENISGLPSFFSGWYLLNGRQTGTYTFEDGIWHLIGKKTPVHATIICNENVHVVGINDEKAYNYITGNRKYDILPGKYTIELLYRSDTSNTSNTYSTSSFDFTITVKAGKTYRAGAVIRENTIKFTMTEE